MDAPENGQTGGRDIITEAKVQVAEAVKNATTDDAKKNLGEVIRKDLEAVITPADEYLQSVTNFRKSGGQIAQTQEDLGKGNEALKGLVKAAEAAKIAETKNIKIPVSTSPEGLALLAKLADKKLSPETASTIEQLMLDYLIGNKNILDASSPDRISQDFKKSFNRLKSLNPTAARLLGDSIIEAVRDDKIIGPTEQIVRKLFGVETLEESLIDQVGELEKMKNLRRPSAEKEDEFNKLRLLLDQKTTEAFFKNANTPNYFTADDNMSIRLYLLRGLESPGLAESLAKLDVDLKDIERYRKLEKDLHGHLNLVLYKQYAPGYESELDRLQRAFDKDKIMADFFEPIKDGEKIKFKFSREKRKEFKDLITKYYFEALKHVHKDKSSLFQQKLSGVGSTSYSYYLSGVGDVIKTACKDIIDLHREEFLETDTVKFLEDIDRFQGSIMVLSQTLHDLPFHARSLANFEKFPEFLQFLFPSQLAELFDDKYGLMQMARDEISSLIREKLVLNGNKFPAGLKSGKYKEEGVRWSAEFEEELRDVMLARLRDLGINLDEKEEGWRLDRVITYASGIGIANLIDAEVESTADPATANFEDIDPLMAAVALKHNWRGGRGNPFAGIIAKYLLAMNVDLYPEMKGFGSRLWKQKSFVPKNIADLVDHQMKVHGDQALEALFDRSGSYQELVSMLNFATSLISRGGWRFRALRDELMGSFKTITGQDKLGDIWKEGWNASNWKELFDLSMSEYGNASLWVFLTSGPNRIESELKTLLTKQLGNIDLTDEEFEEYSSKEGLQKLIYFTNKDGKKDKMNFFEIKTIRSDQLRGETFFRQLRRNPGDFFMLLSQLVPELGTDSVIFLEGKKEWNTFYEKGTPKTKLEKERDEDRKKELIKRFGEDGFETLKKVNQWVKTRAKELGFVKVNGDIDTGGFVKYLRRTSTTAYERMMKNNESLMYDPEEDETVRNRINDLNKEINNTTDEQVKKTKREEIENLRKKIPVKQRIKDLKDDINKTADEQVKRKKRQQIDDLRKRLNLYVRAEDFAYGDEKNKRLAEAIFGNDGLMKILTGLKTDDLDNYFGVFGNFDSFGKDNIFYRMGHSWTMKQGDINPYAADLNHYAIYKHLGAVGESVQVRWLGDAAAGYKEVMTKIPNLESVLLHATKDGNFEEIFKLHEALFSTLKNIIGNEYAYRANFILASVVTQFFWEHSLTRDPKLMALLPANILARLSLGKDISLSKLLTENIHAYSMDTNAARSYFLYLQQHEWIPKEGLWSMEQLQHAFDAKSDTYFVGEVAPRLIWFIIAFLLWSYIKKAIEEQEPKK